MPDSLTPDAAAAANGADLDKVQTQRARWATRRMTVKSSSTKRRSLLNRHNRKKSSASEKSVGAPGGDGGDGHGPFSIGDDNHDDDADASEEEEEEEDTGKRTLFFNLPLPDDMVDEEGHPSTSYARNKIRTAKYTPLSFIPKNLWFQFHNVANIFFLFVIILVVCILPSHTTLSTSAHLLDLPHFWQRQPRPQRRPSHCHHLPYRHQGCHRGLPTNSHRH